MNKDYKEAFSFFLTSAGQGHADAQKQLGVMYQNALGVQKDYSEAVKWYRLAAKYGNLRALSNIELIEAEQRNVTAKDTPSSSPIGEKKHLRHEA